MDRTLSSYSQSNGSATLCVHVLSLLPIISSQIPFHSAQYTTKLSVKHKVLGEKGYGLRVSADKRLRVRLITYPVTGLINSYSLSLSPLIY